MSKAIKFIDLQYFDENNIFGCQGDKTNCSSAI